MNTLSIKDLALTCELDRGAMAHVRGGHGKMQQPSHGLSPMPVYFPSYNSTVDVGKLEYALRDDQGQELRCGADHGSWNYRRHVVSVRPAP